MIDPRIKALAKNLSLDHGEIVASKWDEKTLIVQPCTACDGTDKYTSRAEMDVHKR